MFKGKVSRYFLCNGTLIHGSKRKYQENTVYKRSIKLIGLVLAWKRGLNCDRAQEISLFLQRLLPSFACRLLEVSDRGGNGESIALVLHAMKLKALEKMQCKTI